MILTNYFLKKKIRRLAAGRSERAGYYRTFQDVQHILVFYDGRDSEPVAACVELLRKLHKEVIGCMLVSSGAPSSSSSLADTGASTSAFSADYPVSIGKSLNIWGFPSDTVRREIDALPADLLIDLTRQHCYPMQYLVLRHPSPFKVGPKREGLELYDLSILLAERDDTAYLFKQILFYLQSIHP